MDSELILWAEVHTRRETLLRDVAGFRLDGNSRKLTWLAFRGLLARELRQLADRLEASPSGTDIAKGLVSPYGASGSL
jgi:hypothetical protein